jgi:hypothetical protein
MSDLAVSALLVGPGIIAAIIYAAKCLFAVDLDIRTHREEARLRYLQALDRTRRYDDPEDPNADPESHGTQ